MCSGIHAQDFIPRDKEKTDLTNRHQSWHEWSVNKDLDQEVGWKWYGRWLEEQVQRSTSTGAWPEQAELFHAAEEVAALKNSNINRTNSAWVPVGPSQFPTIPGGRLFKGMGRINTVAFHPTDSNTLWVGVAQGGVWKSTNGGQSWRPLTDDLPILRISDIAIDYFDPDIIYISIGDYAYLDLHSIRILVNVIRTTDWVSIKRSMEVKPGNLQVWYLIKSAGMPH